MRSSHHLFLGFVILSTLFIACTNGKTGQFIALAEQTNKQLPMQVGEGITTDRCQYDAQTTSMNYFLTASLADESPAALDLLAKQTKVIMLAAMRTNPDFDVFKTEEITINYLYANKEGKKLFEIKLTPTDYQQ